MDGVKKDALAALDSVRKDAAGLDVLKERVASLEAVKKDVAALRELKRAGLVQVQLDRFMNAVVGAIINAAAKVFI